MNDVPNVLNQSRQDDPRLLLSAPFRAVHFVFGLFGSSVPPLPGRALVGSLTALGFTDEASRGILLRLRRAGFLESHRHGREASYALSPRSLALLDEISRRATQDSPAWDGVFHALVVSIPPSERAFREQLRRRAAYAGFGVLAPGLLIAPYASSRTAIGPLLSVAPRGARVSSARLTIDSPDALAVVAEAWDLSSTADLLREETGRMTRAAASAEARPPVGPEALVALWQGIGPFFEVLSGSPPLPNELLPADWPLPAARATFFRLASVVADPARAWVQQLADVVA